MKGQYDIPNVVAGFLQGLYEDRAKLMEEFRDSMVYMQQPQRLLTAEVAEACLRQPGCTPEMTVRMGIVYGMALGVLLERDRLERKTRLI